jgi:hypothetical protein
MTASGCNQADWFQWANNRGKLPGITGENDKRLACAQNVQRDTALVSQQRRLMETCQVSVTIVDATSKIGFSQKISPRGWRMSAFSPQPVKSVSVRKNWGKTCDDELAEHEEICHQSDWFQ